jgi:hypothetical protein
MNWRRRPTQKPSLEEGNALPRWPSPDTIWALASSMWPFFRASWARSRLSSASARTLAVGTLSKDTTAVVRKANRSSCANQTSKKAGSEREPKDEEDGSVPASREGERLARCLPAAPAGPIPGAENRGRTAENQKPPMN